MRNIISGGGRLRWIERCDCEAEAGTERETEGECENDWDREAGGD